MNVAGIICFAGTILLVAPLPALAGDAQSSKCEIVPLLKDEDSVKERSQSTALALINYVAKYWDIATSEKPKKVSVSRVEDPSGDGSELDFHNASFESFQAGFYRYPDGTAMPSELSTTSTKFNLPCGLKVGQPQIKVRAVLGEPTQVQRDAFIYGTGGDRNGEVIFTFKRGKLTKVTWGYDTH